MIRHYHDGMVRMLKEGKWKINEPGGAAWVLGQAQDLFLVWPRCGIELRESLIEHGVKGASADPRDIAIMLGWHDLIVLPSDDNYYWRVMPSNNEDGPLMAVRINPKWVPNLVDLLPPGISGSVQAEESLMLSQLEKTDDKPEKVSEKANQENPRFSPTHSPPVLSHGCIPGPPLYGHFRQEAEVENPGQTSKEQGGLRTIKPLMIGLSMGVLGVLGSLMYLGKQWYGDDLTFPNFFWAAWSYGLESRGFHWGGLIAAAILLSSLFYPFILTEVEKDRKKAREIRALAEQEGKDLLDDAMQKAKKLLDEAKLTVIQAEKDAAEKVDLAEQNARIMVSEAHKKTKDLWSWAEAKATNAGVTPAEWREVLKVRNALIVQAQEEAVHIIAQAKDQAANLGAAFQAQSDDCQKSPKGPGTNDPESTADDLESFITDRCVLGVEISIKASNLYQAYLDWAKDNGLENPVSQTRFGSLLRDRGFVRTRTGRGVIWWGIGLR